MDKDGIVYTPNFIADYINTRLLEQLGSIDDDFTAIDPSCGLGVFIIDLAHKLRIITGKNYKDIFEKHLYGVDQDAEAVKTLKETIDNICGCQVNSNIVCANSIDYNFNQKFDLVHGNPPYIRIQHLSSGLREKLKSWSLVEGNTDLYICFYELGLNLLKTNGVLGYISPNSFLKNKSGRLLREKLKGGVFELIDFREHLLFNVSTYTAICLSQKGGRFDERTLVPSNIFPVPCANLFQDGIFEGHDNYSDKIENAGPALGDLFDIKVGLATLADSTFYLKSIDGLEPDILKSCVKVSRIKNEQDIQTTDHIIFPYKWENKYVPMTESEFRKFPKCYEYLLEHKDKLMARDRGKIKDDEWFLYGRAQGLNSLWGEKLLIPPLQQKPVFVYSDDKDLLYLSGYAVLKNETHNLHLIKRILESKVMERYSSNFKKVRNGWMSYSKEAIKRFSIPEFTDKEEQWILSGSNGVDDFLLKRYGL